MSVTRVSESQLRTALEELTKWEPDAGTSDAVGAAHVRADILIAHLSGSQRETADAEGIEVQDECEEDLPFAPMWVRRTPEGALVQVCGHAPEHVTKLAPAP